MPKKGFDFAGYATRNNVRCTDGTVIRPGCFHEMDGKTVPLVYQHNHNEIGQVLGHCEMEERPNGMYCYAYCNDSEGGKMAKEAVQHGDINAFSIWANNLKRNANDILHGTIREVSLVLSGADRTALIDTVVAHGEESSDEAEIQFLGGYADMVTEDEYFAHADDGKEDDEQDEPEEEPKGKKNMNNDETIQDVLDSMNEDQRAVLNYIVGKALEEGQVSHADEGGDVDDDDETIQDVIDGMTDKQRDVMNYIVGKALEEGDEADDDEDEGEEDESDEEDEEVKHNAFEDYGEYADPVQYGGGFLSHDELVDLQSDSASFGGSLAKAYYNAVDSGYLQHDDLTAGTDYGIANVDYLFPDARAYSETPDFISRNMDWVDGVLSSVHKTPFARVKSIHANITEDEARAKGYIKGKYKKEEVISLLKRSTDPQTIYKKQRLDKDDMDDITSFDVLAWLKREMQVMLREEIARAILIGDGRLASDDDKIKEDHIRPVYNDADLYTIKFPVEIPEDATDDQKAKALLRAVLKARKVYKGSGNPTFYTKEDELTNALLLENGIGERIYKSESEVATAMRVSKIQPVEVMDNLQIEIADAQGTKTKYDVAGVEVNLADYNVGTNGGAKTDFFSDFDINTNQNIVLYETRLSGAMIKPFSAVTFFYKTVAKKAATTTPEAGE